MIERRTAVVTIYQGDYLDRIRHLEQRAQALADAHEATTRTLDEVPEYLTLAEEHDKLVAEAGETALHVRLQALRRKVWKRLVAEHPPRDGNRQDALAGVNEATFKDALVSYVDPDDPDERTIVGGIEPEDVDELADVDFDRLYLTAFALNRGAAADPKANLVSRLTQKSDETSS